MSGDPKTSKLTYAAQFLAAGILLMTAAMKFTGAEGAVDVFTRLEMEPTGRYVIGAIEFSAGLLLLSPFAAVGALFSVAVMCGAIIAHTTDLGMVVNDDGGRLVMMLFVVLLSSAYVLLKRRTELPIVGSSLE